MEDTPSKPYEAALVTLGQLAGAVPSEGDDRNDAAPDATWIFGVGMWIAWEAKSEAKPDGELGANDVRQTGGHLRYAGSNRSEAVPGDSPALLVTPQERIHASASARAVAEDHVYLVRPAQVLDVFDPLVRAWRTARTRDLENLSIPIWQLSSAAKAPYPLSGFQARGPNSGGDEPRRTNSASQQCPPGTARWPQG